MSVLTHRKTFASEWKTFSRLDQNVGVSVLTQPLKTNELRWQTRLARRLQWEPRWQFSTARKLQAGDRLPCSTCD